MAASADASAPAPRPTKVLSEAAVRSVFEQYDVDESGTIDREELQALAFHLGRLLSPEDLERAFTALDADGNGSIEFEELYGWLNSAEGQPGGKGVQAALRASLTRRVLMKRAGTVRKRFEASLGSTSIKTPKVPGAVDVDVKFSWGATHVTAPGVGVEVAVGGPEAAPVLADTDAEADDKAVVQLSLALKAEVTDAEAGAFASHLNSFLDTATAALREELEDEFPVTRMEVKGPLVAPPLPGAAAGASTGAGAAPAPRVLLLQVFLEKDPVKPVLRELQGVMEDLPGESKAEEEDLTSLVARLASVIRLTLGSSATLAQLLGTEPYEGGGESTTLHLTTSLSKAMLHLVAAFMHVMAVAEYEPGNDDYNPQHRLALVQQVLAGQSVKYTGRVDPTSRRALLTAATLANTRDDDEWGDGRLRRSVMFAGPLRAAAGLLATLANEVFEGQTTADEEDREEELWKDLAFVLTGSPAGHAGPASYGPGAEGDVSQQGFKALCHTVRWLLDNASSVHGIQAAGRGLGASAVFTGLDLGPIGDFLSSSWAGAVADQAIADGDDDNLQPYLPRIMLYPGDANSGDMLLGHLSANGMDKYDHEHGVRTRIAFTSKRQAFRAQLGAKNSDGWRTAAADDKLETWTKAFLEYDELESNCTRVWGSEKASVVLTPVIAGRDVPGALAGSRAAGAPLGMTAARLAGLLPKLQATVAEFQKQEWDDEDDAEEKLHREFMAPWVCVVVDTRGGQPTAAGADAVRSALGLGNVVNGHAVHVSFVDLTSGLGAQTVFDALVEEYRASAAEGIAKYKAL